MDIRGDEGPQVFAELGKNLWEMVRLTRASREDVLEMVEIHGRERLDRALSRGKGLVVVTGHLGSWELMAAHWSALGYPVNVVATPLKDPKLDALLVSMRERFGARNIPRGGGGRDLLRALRRKEIVAILIDQDTRVPGVYVDFMGTEAHTPAGVVRLVMRSGAPVISMAIHRRGDGGHLIEVGQEIEMRITEDVEEDVRENTARLSKAVETFIRLHPRQWVWMHERWKTRPPWEKRVRGNAFLGAALMIPVLAAGCGVPTEEPVREELMRIPDQVIADFQRTETREGALVWKLKAARGEVYQSDHQVDLREMTVDFYDEQGVRHSRLSADSGRVDSQTQDMEARGHVVVENHEGVVLQTNQLRWVSDEELIRSEEEVLIIRGESRLRGRGFVGDPTLERFRILEEVDAVVPEAELGFDEETDDASGGGKE